MNTSQARKWFLQTALSYLGTPYKWGGDDPSGFDCSGFVLECLKTVGFCAETDDYTADSLLQKLANKQKLDNPKSGTLLFYLNKHKQARHVVICLDEFYQIGASGGHSSTVEPKNAWKNNAYVKIRPIKLHLGKFILVDIFDLT